MDYLINYIQFMISLYITYKHTAIQILLGLLQKAFIIRGYLRTLETLIKQTKQEQNSKQNIFSKTSQQCNTTIHTDVIFFFKFQKTFFFVSSILAPHIQCAVQRKFNLTGHMFKHTCTMPNPDWIKSSTSVILHSSYQWRQS